MCSCSIHYLERVRDLEVKSGGDFNSTEGKQHFVPTNTKVFGVFDSVFFLRHLLHFDMR